MLKDWGFIINPQDACVDNKTYNDEKCKTLWHFDDITFSHIDTKFVDEMLEMLDGEFVEMVPIVVTRRKFHYCIGIKIEYSKKGKIEVSMIKHINNMIV